MKYEYGKEYECNGKRPEGLVGGMLVVVCTHGSKTQICMTVKGIAQRIGWVNVKSFRILDDRFKPDPNDWHKRGELPPVGAKCKIVRGGYPISEIEVLGYRDDFLIFWSFMFNEARSTLIADTKLKPLPNEEDKLVEKAKAIVNSWDDSCGKSIAELFVEKGWRPTEGEK